MGDGTPHGKVVSELDAAVEAARLKGVRFSTFVFPRNEVGNLPLLKEYGFIGYRERPASPPGQLGRAVSLAAEFNIRPKRQYSSPPSDGLVAIPSGYFFNWRFGPRKLVPPSVTVARWRNQLRARKSTGGVVHLWLHPHNLITAPSTTDVLDRVLAEVAEAQMRGELRVETQESYCRRMRADVQSESA
jgi:hypothetical protein